MSVVFLGLGWSLVDDGGQGMPIGARPAHGGSALDMRLFVFFVRVTRQEPRRV